MSNENIAVIRRGTGRDAFEVWMNAEDHRGMMVYNYEDEVVLTGVVLEWNGKLYYEGEVVPGGEFAICAGYYGPYWVLVSKEVK